METKPEIILASQSPRRKYLLEQAGLDLTVIPARIEEKTRPGEKPEAYVKRLALEKAMAVAQDHPDAWVIGADTIVVIGDTILEKPGSDQDARQMLERLSGSVHLVFTGYTLCSVTARRTVTRAARTEVLFKHLTDQEIDWYIGTGEPFDKAGAYAIQGIGTFLVRSINGSYTNVVGLPVCEVVELLVAEQVIQRGGVRLR